VIRRQRARAVRSRRLGADARVRHRGSGFTGSRLVDALPAQSDSVTVIEDLFYLFTRRMPAPRIGRSTMADTGCDA
jgi:hypothetical protein